VPGGGAGHLNPAGQAWHPSGPSCCPALHINGSPEVALQARPSGQLRHSVAPSTLLNLPAVHGDGSVQPLPGQEWPTGHTVHADDPRSLNFPGLHALHSTAPSTLANVPGVHRRGLNVRSFGQ
jgi:hypothetical protein